jgi:hypothetical protein
MLRKTFEAALCTFVTRKFSFLKGTMIVNLIVKELKKLVDNYYPSPSHLKPGQMLRAQFFPGWIWPQSSKYAQTLWLKQ